MILGLHRLTDTGPLDDPELNAMDRLEEDAEFCTDFLSAHWQDVIDLITSPTWATNLLAAKVDGLKAKLYAAEREHLRG